LQEEAKRQSRPVFFPLNFWYGAYLLVFAPDSPTLEQIIGGRAIEGFYQKLMAETLPSALVGVPEFEQMQRLYLDAIEGRRPLPQCGISANITSAMVVKQMIKWICGAEIRLAPEAILAEIRW
ncbi:MAG: hypothetical protein IMF16_06370, partial [Proteobacteria bacterium]|nr:hypothetical protein [Pseudomonadota bacterium]